MLFVINYKLLGRAGSPHPAVVYSQRSFSPTEARGRHPPAVYRPEHNTLSNNNYLQLCCSPLRVLRELRERPYSFLPLYQGSQSRHPRRFTDRNTTLKLIALISVLKRSDKNTINPAC